MKKNNPNPNPHHHKVEAFRPQSNARRFPEGPCEIEDRLVTALHGGRLGLLFLHMAFQTILGLDSSYLFTTSFYFSISFLFKYVMQRMTRHVLFNQPVRSEIYFNSKSISYVYTFLQSADKLQVQQEKQEFKMHATARKIIFKGNIQLR